MYKLLKVIHPEPSIDITDQTKFNFKLATCHPIHWRLPAHSPLIFFLNISFLSFHTSIIWFISHQIGHPNFNWTNTQIQEYPDEHFFFVTRFNFQISTHFSRCTSGETRLVRSSPLSSIDQHSVYIRQELEKLHKQLQSYWIDVQTPTIWIYHLEQGLMGIVQKI